MIQNKTYSDENLYLKNDTYRHCTFHDARIHAVENVFFEDCTFYHARFFGLQNTSFTGCQFKYGSWRGEMSGVSLVDCHLPTMDFTQASFEKSTMKSCYLAFASFKQNVTGLYLSCCCLDGVFLSPDEGAISPIWEANIPSVCPDSGAFIGWKQAYGTGHRKVIVKLQIPASAARTSSTSRKCRASKAKVLAIYGKSYDEAYSMHDHLFTYKVGETVVPDRWDPNRWNECSGGIHFFISRQEAIDY